MINSKIIKKIKRYNNVSFDIFDTLVKRNCQNPTDVFKLIEEKYKIEDFCKARITAEIITRKEITGEITLSEIYDNITIKQKKYSKEELMELEKKTEIAICTINKEMVAILDYCKKNNKQIILTTDMYLPLETIKSILDNLKIPYNRIYLSSEVKKMKADKTIYNYILKDLKIDKKDIIHIGDNLKSDFINPLTCGIRAIRIKKIYKKIAHYNYEKKDNIDLNIFNSFIGNNIDYDEGYFYKNGFSILGPLLFFFCQWLNKEITKNGIKKVLFLSRDGLIIKRAYETIYGKNKNLKYFYASRRALIVPSLKYYTNIKDMISNMYNEKYISIKSILNNLGIEINEAILSRAKKNKVDIYIKNNLDDIINNSLIYNFLESLKKDIYLESKKENKAFIKYLESNVDTNSKTKIALVDIGWFGNMQKAIEMIVAKERKKIIINGYYVGMNPFNKNQINYNMKGYLFDSYKNPDLYELERRFNSVFETMFTASHSSLKKYDLEGTELKLEFKDNDNLDKIKSIEDYQKGALEFIEKFNVFQKKIYVELLPEDVFNIASDFGVNPTYEDAVKWGNLSFNSGSSENYIAKSQPVFKYFFNPQNFINDMKNSYWKIGFMKRILKIRINYNKIYELLRGRNKI